jgi:hypothetical protein
MTDTRKEAALTLLATLLRERPAMLFRDRTSEGKAAALSAVLAAHQHNRRACCHTLHRAAAHEEQRCAAQLQHWMASIGTRAAAAAGASSGPPPPACRQASASTSLPSLSPRMCCRACAGAPKASSQRQHEQLLEHWRSIQAGAAGQLAGRSCVEETRAEVLERTRRERERRRQEKLEQKSATSIQARQARGSTCLLALYSAAAISGRLAMLLAGLYIKTVLPMALPPCCCRLRGGAAGAPGGTTRPGCARSGKRGLASTGSMHPGMPSACLAWWVHG